MAKILIEQTHNIVNVELTGDGLHREGAVGVERVVRVMWVLRDSDSIIGVVRDLDRLFPQCCKGG